MITDLLVAASGIDAEAVARCVPPACRREPPSAPTVNTADGQLVLALPEWRPRVGARHLVPSLSLLTGVPYGVRFELSARAAGTWSPWIATATIGPASFAGLPTTTEALACDIDVYTSGAPLDRVRLRVRVGAPDVRALAASPWMVTLSACDLDPTRSEKTAVSVPRLAVPALSQLEAPPEIALRICSPTSVAMVLAYRGVTASALSVAEDVYHGPTDRYGVWPAAIRTAGRRGIAGYLLRFPDWSSAAWCLAHDLPVIASVSYGPGELTGAPQPETSGHLVVLTGCDADHVFVNDPVAPTAAEVPRRYRLDEMKRAWLDRSGVGYVLFTPDALRV